MTFVNIHPASATPAPSTTVLELVCPVNSLVTLRTAVDNGANWIRLDQSVHGDIAGLPGQHLALAALPRGIRYAHDRHCKVLLTIDAQVQLRSWTKCRDAIDLAAQYGVDAIALSDPALLLYAAAQHPGLHLHYSMPDEALGLETIDFFRQRFGVSRILLPRVLTLAQVARIAANTPVELQVVGFGRHSAIIAGNDGASGNKLPGTESRPHPDPAPSALCAIAESAANDGSFALDWQPDAGTLKLLPQLAMLGIRAIQVEAPADDGPAHLAQVTRVWRAAVDECLENIDHYSVKPSWVATLNRAAKNLYKC